jgi:APA family basic amino acid/polyamine antiporter
VWIMRVTDPGIPRPFRAPMLPLVSTMGILVNGGMMFFLGPDNWLRLIIWLILGLIIYFGYSRRHSALRARTVESADSV